MTLDVILLEARKSNPRFPTKKSLADAVGCSLEYIRRIEAGIDIPSSATLARIIDALELGQDDADRCWVLLAEHKLDALTREHVTVQGNVSGVGPRAAKIAAEWVGALWPLSEEDQEMLQVEIIERLRD